MTGGDRPLDRVYAVRDPEAFEAAYDDWAARYDADLAAADYRTPGRVAAALARVADPARACVLDFACGTGLSGAALRAAGFATIDGNDLSQGMLDVAAAKGIYRHLWKSEVGAALPEGYDAIAAVGAISRGAAPPETLTLVAAALAPGAFLALSFNDHTLADPAYTGRLAGLVDDGTFAIRSEEHGPHLPGENMNSTVYVLERLG